MEMRKILVTGAAGAVGHAVTRALRQRGHFVRGFDREAARQEGEHLLGSVLDIEALAQATRGVDTVVLDDDLRVVAVMRRGRWVHGMGVTAYPLPVTL